MAAGLADEAPGRTFETWEPQPTRDGFLAEYTYRTTATDAQPSALSVGLVARHGDRGLDQPSCPHLGGLMDP